MHDWRRYLENLSLNPGIRACNSNVHHRTRGVTLANTVVWLDTGIGPNAWNWGNNSRWSKAISDWKIQRLEVAAHLKEELALKSKKKVGEAITTRLTVESPRKWGLILLLFFEQRSTRVPLVAVCAIVLAAFLLESYHSASLLFPVLLLCRPTI